MRTRSRKDHGASASQRNAIAPNPSLASTLDDVVAQLANVSVVLQQIGQPTTSTPYGRHDSDAAISGEATLMYRGQQTPTASE